MEKTKEKAKGKVKMLKPEKKLNKGITLIALVVTIIILIILAGVGINLVLGQDGILNKAKEAKENTIKASKKEEVDMAISEVLTENNR